MTPNELSTELRRLSAAATPGTIWEAEDLIDFMFSHATAIADTIDWLVAEVERLKNETLQNEDLGDDYYTSLGHAVVMRQEQMRQEREQSPTTKGE